MIRVYLSSTYEDLKEYRLAAAKAIAGLECHAVGMEDYPADQRPPLEKCLEDVRSCQLYVGLFAWCYGSLAPGHDKSFTHLEYEEALRRDLPCLIFLLDSKMPWPDNGKDRDAKSILELRMLLEEKHTRKFFHSTQQLETVVTQSVALTLGRQKADVPGLLPYLGNRSVQRDELAEALQEHRGKRPRRPFVAIVTGSEDEAHERFLDRLKERILPELLDSESVQDKFVHWAEPEGTLDERRARLLRNLAETLTGRREAGLPELVRQVAGLRAPLMLSASVSSRDWQAVESDLVRSWIRFWSDWPELPPGQFLLAFLCLKYESTTADRFSGVGRWFKRRQTEGRNQGIRAFVASLQASTFEGVTSAFLSELQSVRESDVEDLIERDVRAFVAARGRLDPIAVADDLKSWKRKFFDDWEAKTESSRIPMERLAQGLRGELVRRVNEGG